MRHQVGEAQGKHLMPSHGDRYHCHSWIDGQVRQTDIFLQFLCSLKNIDYFCTQYTKTHHEANLSQRPVAGNNKNAPPISESPQAEGSWSHQRLRLTEMTPPLLQVLHQYLRSMGNEFS